MTTSSSPVRAPNYVAHRESVAAADGIGAITRRARGVNMAGFESAHIQVLPETDAVAGVEVLWWSETAGKFIQENTSLAKAAVGASIPYEFTVDCKGRIMFVKIATLTGGAAVSVNVSGFGRRHPD